MIFPSSNNHDDYGINTQSKEKRVSRIDAFEDEIMATPKTLIQILLISSSTSSQLSASFQYLIDSIQYTINDNDDSGKEKFHLIYNEINQQELSIGEDNSISISWLKTSNSPIYDAQLDIVWFHKILYEEPSIIIIILPISSTASTINGLSTVNGASLNHDATLISQLNQRAIHQHRRLLVILSGQGGITLEVKDQFARLAHLSPQNCLFTDLQFPLDRSVMLQQ